MNDLMKKYSGVLEELREMLIQDYLLKLSQADNEYTKQDLSGTDREIKK